MMNDWLDSMASVSSPSILTSGTACAAGYPSGLRGQSCGCRNPEDNRIRYIRARFSAAEWVDNQEGVVDIVVVADGCSVSDARDLGTAVLDGLSEIREKIFNKVESSIAR